MEYGGGAQPRPDASATLETEAGHWRQFAQVSDLVADWYGVF